LIPNEQQAFLYGYRSLCKELFVKENALNVFRDELDKRTHPDSVMNIFKGMEIGTRLGLGGLKEQKKYLINL
jgi:hypothetical protein